jgi:large conductance mechanosensitive channel
MHKNLDEKFAVLKRGPTYNTTDGHGYNTLKQAADDGAVVMAYGYFFLSLPFPFPSLVLLPFPP